MNNIKNVLNEKEPSHKNISSAFYNLYAKDIKTLEFTNIPRNNNYIYDLELQINILFLNDLFFEQYMVYSKKIDLTEIGIPDNNVWKWILVSIAIAIFILLVAFFIIKFLRLKNTNDSLQKEIKTLEFSNDIQKNVLIKGKQISKKESDFETTFI